VVGLLHHCTRQQHKSLPALLQLYSTYKVPIRQVKPSV